MDGIKNTNLDGNLTTTSAGSSDSTTDEYVKMTYDEVLDQWSLEIVPGPMPNIADVVWEKDGKEGKKEGIAKGSNEGNGKDCRKIGKEGYREALKVNSLFASAFASAFGSASDDEMISGPDLGSADRDCRKLGMEGRKEGMVEGSNEGNRKDLGKEGKEIAVVGSNDGSGQDCRTTDEREMTYDEMRGRYFIEVAPINVDLLSIVGEVCGEEGKEGKKEGIVEGSNEGNGQDCRKIGKEVYREAINMNSLNDGHRKDPRKDEKEGKVDMKEGTVVGGNDGNRKDLRLEGKEKKEGRKERMVEERKERKKEGMVVGSYGGNKKDFRKEEKEGLEGRKLRMRISELETQLREAQGRISCLEEQLMDRKDIIRKEIDRKEIERKVLERKKEAAYIATISPFLLGEDNPLPPLSQRVGGVWVSPVQSPPPPMISGSFEETVGEACKGGRLGDGDTCSEADWKLVGGKRRRRNPSVSPPSLPDSGMVSFSDVDGSNGGCAVRCPQPRQCSGTGSSPRLPLSSVVSITGRTEGFSYAAALRSARKHIDLETLGIGMTHVRRINGRTLIEISGEESCAKAEELAIRLRDVLKDSAVISCPKRKSELRVVGVDESVLESEVAEAISRVGDCPIGEVRVGSMRSRGNGLSTVWVQLPAVAATKVVEAEHICLGWTTARVELLKARPLQCYRCWEFGHTKNMCKSAVDRCNACFRCGQPGHMASTCRNKAHCVVCRDAGLNASHRLGGTLCMAQMQYGKDNGDCVKWMEEGKEGDRKEGLGKERMEMDRKEGKRSVG